MNKKTHCLIIGQGKIGSQVSNTLIKEKCIVTGMARGKRADYQLNEQVGFIQADATEVAYETLQSATHLVIIVTPSERGESGYRNSYLSIAKHIASVKDELQNLQRLIFISSTGIYGQNDAEWIDEYTQPARARSVTSQIIFQSEQILKEAFTDKCIIIRPSGIYGNDRLMRVRKAKELGANADEYSMEKYAWTNRIMDTDLVKIIVNVVIAQNPKPIYLATDFAPVTSFELTNWLCQKLHGRLPTSDDGIAPSGKRIHSNIPREWLEYPDWQVGYQNILQNNNEI